MNRLRVYGRAMACLFFAPAAGFLRLIWKGGLLWLIKELNKRTERAA